MKQLEFEKAYIIGFGEIDARGLLKPSGFTGIFQDLTTWHSDELKISREFIPAVWFLTKLSVQMIRPVHSGERLTGRTWCAGLKGVSWLRCMELVDERGEVVATGTSVWVMLCADTFKILRPTQLIPNCNEFTNPNRPVGVMPGKLRGGELTPCRTHQVSYTDLDVNNHLNNTKIVDIISNALELHLHEGYVLNQLQVNYIAQTRYDEVIALSRGKTADGAVSVCGSVDGEVKFQALAQFKKI